MKRKNRITEIRIDLDGIAFLVLAYWFGKMVFEIFTK